MINLPDRAKLTHKARAVTILFPQKPLEILGFLLIADPYGGPVVTCPGEPALNVQRVATAHVMVFEFDDENGIELQGHLWEPYSVEGSISLHLISTSVEAEPWRHNDDTAVVLKRVIGGFPDYRFTSGIAPPEWRFCGQLNHGGGQANYGDKGSLKAVEDYFRWPDQSFAFCQQQLEPFELRHTRLGLIGRLAQQRRLFDSAWNLPTPIGIEGTNCFGYAKT